MPLRSSILLLVPEAEPLVGQLRHAHDPAAFAGIGAHITLLFPFVPAPQIDDAIVAEIRAQLTSAGASGPGSGQARHVATGPLRLTFDRVARFPALAYLALEEPAHVVARIRALQARWPEYPLYEGKFPTITPHLTVAHGDATVLDAVEAELAPQLPFSTTLAHASLFVEDAHGIWHEHARISL